MRTLFLPHAEVVRRLDALSLLGPMRMGFIAHSRGRTAPGLVQATALPGRGIARVTGVGLVPDLPAYSVSSAATSADGVEHATLLLHDLETGKLLACLEAVHLRAIAPWPWASPSPRTRWPVPRHRGWRCSGRVRGRCDF